MPLRNISLNNNIPILTSTKRTRARLYLRRHHILVLRTDTSSSRPILSIRRGTGTLSSSSNRPTSLNDHSTNRHPHNPRTRALLSTIRLTQPTHSNSRLRLTLTNNNRLNLIHRLTSTHPSSTRHLPSSSSSSNPRVPHSAPLPTP
ncbi:hypothetical protein OE88DRAFT_462799 [Heliocybe sulcata]|uniref:Uncharacterized protein n=1 Tax=Heliocybe sulcata TaxID=5364 RepID=A0A5C3MVE2_9AGAM|nr:hypothetical protein OE88DRAFT_462799 [Heliocybe sulcata]